MNRSDPYYILKMLFAARFGQEVQAFEAGAQAAHPALAQASGMEQGSPDAAVPAQGQMPPEGAILQMLSESEKARKIALTEQLTQAANYPPMSEQEAAVLLNGALQQGGRDALALGR